MKTKAAKMRAWLLLAASAIALPAATSARANLVVSGDFAGCSGTTCAGWTFTPAASGSDFEYNIYGDSIGYFPTYAAFGASGGLDDQISQTITTVAGHTYAVKFGVAASTAVSDADLSVSFNGTTYLSLVNDQLPTLSPNTYSFLVTATGASSVLTFSGQNANGYNYLSNVSVSPGPVPGAGLAGLGALALVGCYARARRFQAAVSSLRPRASTS